MKELFYKYFSGKASKEEEKQIMDYVDSSDSAKHEFYSERKLWNIAILHSRLNETTVKKKTVFVRLLRVAAFLAVVFTVGGLGWYWGQTGDETVQVVRVRPGSCVELDLPDGSRVWLNANTVLSYSSSFGKKQRSVNLSGEGYFEVRQSGKPFIVNTERYNVEVLGTKFNIDAYPDNDAFTTSLLEGKVKIHITDETGFRKEILLQPDQYLSLAGNVVQQGVLEDRNHLLWRNGIIYFDNEPFLSMIKKLEKHFQLHIEVKTPGVMDYHCTGKFRQAEGINHILRVLQKDLDFDFQRLDDQTILIR